MSEEKNIAKRVIADVVSSPMVIFPFMVGTAAFASLFALGLKGSAFLGAMLVGLSGVLGSGGMFLTKMILGRDDRVKKIVEESRAQSQKRQAQAA
ncbi:MAG: hypothetical protein ACJZ70_12640 [Limisphaerales bacterium]